MHLSVVLKLPYGRQEGLEEDIEGGTEMLLECTENKTFIIKTAS